MISSKFKILPIIVLLIGLASIATAVTGNLRFMDKFNGNLSAWTTSASGGTVTIVTQNNSPKLKLSDTSRSASVSVTHSYTEPPELYIIEFDMKMVADGDVVKAQLLSSDDAIIAEVDLGSTSDTVSFDTDNATASMKTWANDVYKQVIFVIDVANDDITCYISGASHTYYPLDIVGAAKSYSGTAIAKLRFTTTDAAQAVAYIDEVRIFTPDIAIIGDSIADGKPMWSADPAYPNRLLTAEDETSPPSYQLSQKIEGTTRVPSSVWVSDRAWGGTRFKDNSQPNCCDMYGHMQKVLDQGFKTIILCAGHNDITQGDDATKIEGDLNQIIKIVQKAGITGSHIVLCTIPPALSINTTSERKAMDTYNSWIVTRAGELGAKLADIYTALKDDKDPYILKAAYNKSDGTHLTVLGSNVLAGSIYNAMFAGTEQIGNPGGTIRNVEGSDEGSIRRKVGSEKVK